MTYTGEEVIGNSVIVKVRENVGPPVAQLRASGVFSVCVGSEVESVIDSPSN